MIKSLFYKHPVNTRQNVAFIEVVLVGSSGAARTNKVTAAIVNFYEPFGSSEHVPLLENTQSRMFSIVYI